MFSEHPPGDVEVTVACGGTVISNPVIFTYKQNLETRSKTQPLPEHQSKELNRGSTDRDLTQRLLERLKKLEICTGDDIDQIYEVIHSNSTAFDNLYINFQFCLPKVGVINIRFDLFLLFYLRFQQGISFENIFRILVRVTFVHNYQSCHGQTLIFQGNFSEFEDQLVTMCQKLTTDEWGEDGWGGMRSGEEGLSFSDQDESVLHLAASLGLGRLVCSLLHWAAELPGKRIGREVDALARDSHGFTPLVSFSEYCIRLSLRFLEFSLHCEA